MAPPSSRQSLMSSTISIRPLDPSDAQAFQRLRLEGLENSARGLRLQLRGRGFAVDRDGQRPVPSSGPNAIFGAFADEDLVGVAGFAVHDRMKARHKGVMWGVYVKAEWRGQKVGQALVQQRDRSCRPARDHARSGRRLSRTMAPGAPITASASSPTASSARPSGSATRSTTRNCSFSNCRRAPNRPRHCPAISASRTARAVRTSCATSPQLLQVEIDHGEAGGRIFLAEAQDAVHVALADEKPGQFLEAGIVADRSGECRSPAPPRARPPASRPTGAS